MRLTGSGRDWPRQPLTEASAAKAEKAFTVEFHRLYEPAVRYAKGYVGTAVAEDLVVRAFMKLWETSYEIGEIPDEDVAPLFFCILRNLMKDSDRDRRRRKVLDDQHVLDISGYLNESTDTARVAEGNMIQARTDYIAATLPPKTRRAYELHTEGFDAFEIAKKMRCGYATARWHVYKAVDRIREQLADDGYDVPTALPRGRRGGKQE